MSSPSAAVIGSTGLVGSHILSNLLAADNSTFSAVHTVTRRAPKAESPRLRSIIDTDTTKWAAALSALSPAPATVFSALGTTRAQAGGIANQWKIDHDLNVELARAAKAAGTQTYVFVSSGGTRGALAGMSPYAKMKNGVEDTVRDLGFEQAIILRPGVILGQREESRLAEGIAQSVVRGLGWLYGGLRDCMAQEAGVIANAATAAAQLAAEGKAPSKYWVLEQADIVRLGRTEQPAQTEQPGQKL